jgi:hypothetical protein
MFVLPIFYIAAALCLIEYAVPLVICNCDEYKEHKSTQDTHDHGSGILKGPSCGRNTVDSLKNVFP